MFATPSTLTLIKLVGRHGFACLDVHLHNLKGKLIDALEEQNAPTSFSYENTSLPLPEMMYAGIGRSFHISADEKHQNAHEQQCATTETATTQLSAADNIVLTIFLPPFSSKAFFDDFILLYNIYVALSNFSRFGAPDCTAWRRF